LQTTITIKERRALPWLFLAVFLDHTSINIIFPVLTIVCFDPLSALFSPDTATATRGVWYGIIISVYHLVNIVAAPIFGIASDYLGRRKLLIIAGIGALAMGGFAAISLLAGSIAALVLGRIIGGFCATKAVTQAVVGDIPAGKNKVLNMAYLQAVIAIGALLGPLIGGYAAEHCYTPALNFSIPFILATFIAGLSLIAVFWKLPETLVKKPKPSWRHIFQSAKTLLANPVMVKISLLLLLSQISWSMYYQYIPPILKDKLGFSAPQLGIFLSVIAFWLVLTGGFGIRFMRKWFTLIQLIQLASTITLFGLLLTLLALFFQMTWLIWLAAIPVAVGDMVAYIVLTTLYSDHVSAENQGLVMGICLVVAQLIWFSTGLLGGLLVGIHFILPLFVAPIGVISLLFLFKFKPYFLTVNYE
jgi:DHA1 family tetracycline resistance protein-like MFS transporter